jgi:hypothetical protein
MRVDQGDDGRVGEGIDVEGEGRSVGIQVVVEGQGSLWSAEDVLERLDVENDWVGIF